MSAKASRSDYSFGDTATAGERLAHVARVFEAPSRALLASAVRRGGALAVDVGCGPGHTTRLVHEVVGCWRTVGLDASEAFIAAAARDDRDGVSFVKHDALALPFPTGPADLIYARFLLTHLTDPARAIRGFASQLRWARDSMRWRKGSNLVELRHNPDVKRQATESELDALAAELAEARGAEGAPVAWGLRQLVIEG